MDDKVIMITNPKKSFSYRVTVIEEREALFEKLMNSNGFKFTRIGEGKQLAFTIDIDKLLRSEK